MKIFVKNVNRSKIIKRREIEFVLFWVFLRYSNGLLLVSSGGS